jgi:acyl-CoA synthetase (AMP-forming)/AMP-acid ligase II
VAAPEPADLPARLRRVPAVDPDATGLLFAGREYPWSYLGEAAETLERLAGGGRRRVGVVLRNRPGTFAALIAVLAGGHELVTLSPFHGDVRLAEDIRDLAPDVVVAGEGDWSRPVVRGAVSEVGALGIDAGDGEQALRARAAAPVPLRATAAPGDPVAVLMLTSGTTGRPKRVPLGYRKLVAAFEAGGTPIADEPIRLHTRPTILWASLVHIGGLYFAVANVAAGRPTALLERFAVEPWAELVRTLRPALVGLPPAAMRMVLQSDLPVSTFAGVRAATSGTAALPVADAEAFTARFGLPVLSVYGATEFAGAIAGWDLRLYEEWGEAKRGSVGRAHHGIALRIVDRDTGEPLAAGERGLLEARGDQLPSDGWTRTTDLASLDADGFLFIHGRVDDAINRGGFTIVPTVIEEALRAHPGVRDASAVGIPDARLGEVPVAAVELGETDPPSEAELRAWLADRLTRYQLPTEIRVVATLPRTPSLKVSRPDVQALFAPGPAGRASA